ncbi:unnamed protein product [Cylindrotheca closterium]|uniref:DUF6824 domain-containing protein n=1 Tax=Cylindrotheca closterium TaxID=2856 RepID=A0AAD2FG35_9STRA|nr:unnamed protein product [Cylindrotheca closterium]
MVDRGLFDKQYHTAASLVGIPALPSQERPNHSRRKFLGSSFQPSNWDVICHNSKEYQDHIGNKRFKICVENHLSSYMKAPSRIAKSVVITNLVNSIRDSATEQGGGGFVRFDNSCGLWYEVGEKIARDKVGQALREAARLQDEKQKSRTIDLSSSSHPSLVGPFPLSEPSIVKSTASGGEHEQASIGKWVPKGVPGRLSPFSHATSNNEDSRTSASNSRRSFWFRRNVLEIMPPKERDTQNSSTTDEMMTDFVESAEGGQQQAPGSSGTRPMPFSSNDHVLLPSSLPASPAMPPSSMGGVETADALLEWFENDDV